MCFAKAKRRIKLEQWLIEKGFEPIDNPYYEYTPFHYKINGSARLSVIPFDLSTCHFAFSDSKYFQTVSDVKKYVKKWLKIYGDGYREDLINLLKDYGFVKLNNLGEKSLLEQYGAFRNVVLMVYIDEENYVDFGYQFGFGVRNNSIPSKQAIQCFTEWVKENDLQKVEER